MTTNATPAQDQSKATYGEMRPVGEGIRLQVMLKDYFHPDCGDAYYFAWAADRLHLGIRIENMAADEGSMCIEVTLYESVPTVDCRDVHAWWPRPAGWPSQPSAPLDDDDLWDALNDARWAEEQGRAYMLRVRHSGGCCRAARAAHGVTRQEWFADFSGLELTGDLDYRSFPHTEVLSSGRIL